jgi:hypothetical protein
VLRVLLAEEVAGRDRAAINMRRKASGLPTGKTFDAWEEKASAIRKPTQQALKNAGVDRPRRGVDDLRPVRERQVAFHRSAPAPRYRQGQDRRVAHARDTSPRCFAATAATTASPRPRTS